MDVRRVERSEAGIPLQTGGSQDFEDDRARPVRVWKKNERLVYVANFLHMTMYTMCMGGVFDIFLYNLSQEQDFIQSDVVRIGANAAPIAPTFMSTYDRFELMFQFKPDENAPFSPNETCWDDGNYCARSVLHVTDRSGNGDCCKIGNRLPAVFLFNGTYLSLAMDHDGQNESASIRDYPTRCQSKEPLTVGKWHDIKVKVCDETQSKGEMNPESVAAGGALLLFVDGVQICEVPGTAYHSLPKRSNASVFLGALQKPYVDAIDIHAPANGEVTNVRYGKPASNLFVGTVNSIQGLLSVFLMYPIGWIGDRTSRYTVLQVNMSIAVLAASLMVMGVFLRHVTTLLAGIVIFTFYQQGISSTIYACLADNVETHRRTRAGVNYKTFSALAMSLAPALQLCVILAEPDSNSWSQGTFNQLLLPGWALLPFITVAIIGMTAVGKTFTSLPTVDEAEPDERTGRSGKLSQTWLDERVCLGWKRRYVVATAVNVFFIMTLLANGMTVRYFNLYFTQVLKFSPAGLCALNALCRLWIAGFAQLGKPLTLLCGRSNLALMMHVASSLFTLGIYGGGWFEPGLFLACASYFMRFACLHTRDPLLYSVTMDCVPQEQRARWASLNSLRTLSFSASAVLGGYLADHHGYVYSFNITVIALLAGTVFVLPAWLWFPKQEGGERRASSPVIGQRTGSGNFSRQNSHNSRNEASVILQNSPTLRSAGL
eukprot:TRINITY_DN8360_c0_g1_i1.p1 TRINITY_DN8360_c0_g1~~TRINITY_DN8360_c0_g1_i1.p1  ORF type:complete len:715 (-),score=122.28 TRINITY_DN8360_c0_g1_i1:138-2282(-)